MSGIKFSHFELFKIAIKTIYIISGLLILAMYVDNASNLLAKEYTSHLKYEIIEQEMVDCENCDEID